MTHVASLPIVDVEDVKSALEITDESANDQLIVLVEAISGAVEDYLGRPVVARNVTESVDGDGTDMLLLKPYLISVTTVVIDDITVTAATQRVFYPKTGEVRLLDRVFTSGSQNIDLVYRHGWEPDDIPNQIKRATVKWCVSEWLSTKHDRVGVTTKSDTQNSISYALSEIPIGIETLLNPWRIVSFG
jgi:hypothetical protein